MDYFVTGGTMHKREPVMARAWEQQGLAPEEVLSLIHI